MKHTDTKAFGEHIAPTDAEIIQLMAECDQLARAVEERKLANVNLKPYKQKPTKAFENRLLSKQSQLDELGRYILKLHNDVSDFSWRSLLDMLVQAEEHVWNERQKELGNKERADYEGKYEDSYRDYMGWPLGASLSTSDFPDGSEGKYLSGGEATFRVGKVGKRAFSALLRSLALECPEETMTSEEWDVLFDGEVSAGKIYHTLPEVVRTKIQQALPPEKVLSCYPSIVFLTDTGFFQVPREDFPRALRLIEVSQMSPKYRIKREYIEQRVLACTKA